MDGNSLSSDFDIPIGVPEPLVPDDAGCGGELDLHFDEFGSPAEARDSKCLYAMATRLR